MTKVIGVRFRTAGKVYFFDPLQLEIKRGDHVIVETARGIEFGTVVAGVHEVEDDKVIQPLKPVMRIAGERDIEQEAANKEKEKEAFKICKEKILKHGLEMKLIDAEYTFDNNKVLFYFTADGRIDFRELVKDLASVFKTRIELRQIGVRDETKIRGGIGICGRPLCCHSYLSDFVPVSIKMAKEQNLSLNPTKISGVCGRLMCCLKNEEDTYEELNRKLPGVGDYVQTADGLHGEVQSVNVLRQLVKVLVEVGDEKELKEYEEKIMGADEKILALETRLFTELITDMAEFIPQIQINANIIARLDCLLSFAKAAEEHRYVRPVVADDCVLQIKAGRHPVIETQLPMGEEYVPNDIELDTEQQQIMIITGPNMAGKSALLRQTALITLMAQMGCFVPAEAARIGIVDKIFTRVGASDNISLGESTFMVEMTEASDILNNVTPRSLVLFDELGRGTSTYDGISIAWAIVEYLHEHQGAQARTLFATHYHELNEMEKNFSRIKNYNVSVKELNGKVIFLRKLMRGGSEHSFGIHVAEIAGMPKSIVNRANTILKQLEADNAGVGVESRQNIGSSSAAGMQLSFFQLDDPVLCQIRDEILGLDINNLTPVEALNKLNEVKKIITGRS